MRHKIRHFFRGFLRFPKNKIFMVAGLAFIVLGTGYLYFATADAPMFRKGLDFERSVFAKVTAEGKVTFLEKAEYERGEAVHYALMRVGKFKRGDDNRNWVELDLKVREGSKVIFERAGLLGEAGHTELKNDEAESPSGVFTATASLKPGDYSIELTVYDKVGGGKARDTGTFTVK